MDSMAERLEQLLNDEGTISQIQQILSSLRDSGSLPEQQSEQQSAASPINPAMMNGLMSMLPALTGGGNAGGKGGGDDPNLALLRALRPFLSTKRKKRVGEAVKLMKMMDMLPMLQQSGLLSGFLGGDEDE